MKKILYILVLCCLTAACTKQFNDMCPYRDLPESCGHICRTIELYYEYDWKYSAWSDKWNYTYEKALKDGHYDNPNKRITCVYNFYGSLAYYCYESGEYKKEIKQSYDKSLDAIKQTHKGTSSLDFTGEIIYYYQQGRKVKAIKKGTGEAYASKKKVYEERDYVRGEDGTLQKVNFYDKKGALIQESVINEDSITYNRYRNGELISSCTSSLLETQDEEIISEYTYDEYGNWVTCTRKKNGKVIETGVRIITYYNDFHIYYSIDPDKYNQMFDSATLKKIQSIDSIMDDYIKKQNTLMQY